MGRAPAPPHRPPHKPSPDKPSPDDAPAEDSAARACRNCGALQVGTYCHDCGQRFLDGPITFREIAEQAVRIFMDLDRGFLYTLRMMTLQPNEVVRRYLDGERRRFMSPVAYFLLAVTASIVVIGLLQEQFVTAIAAHVTDAELQVASAALGVDSAREYAETMHRYAVQYQTYLHVAGMLPVAVALRLMLRHRTTAEWTVFATFVCAQQALYNTMLVPVFPMISMETYGILAISANVAVLTWALTGMTPPSLSRTRTVLMGLAAYVMGVLFTTVVFVGAVVAIHVASSVP